MSAQTIEIRDARESDAEQMLGIYAPYVRDTVITFEEVVPELEQFRDRVRKYLSGWRCLVVVQDDRLLGYAYGSTHRERSAYRWSVETTIYLDPTVHRQGLGRRLYGALLPALAEAGYCNAFAGITLPNAASVGLHQAMGFEPIGTFSRVGYKLGAWRDVGWFQLRLRDEPPQRSSS
ncbi:MAG: N-acetyltransferase [Gammaproteobacteria bacterium]|nr:N-acetyltransferase [Gammaproteobacteria bacterium]